MDLQIAVSADESTAMIRSITQQMMAAERMNRWAFLTDRRERSLNDIARQAAAAADRPDAEVIARSMADTVATVMDLYVEARNAANAAPEARKAAAWERVDRSFSALSVLAHLGEG